MQGLHVSAVTCVVCEISFEWNEIPGPLPKVADALEEKK